MRKIALVIGNNEYESMIPLKCATKDATDISKKLETLGFDCVCELNIDYRKMCTVIHEFEEKINEYEIGLVYFAGHGFEIEKTNYLAMTDTGIGINDIPVKHMAFKLDEFIEIYDNSSLNIKIIILDACRENFSTGTRGNNLNGFAPMFAPKGTIIAYSTSPGQKAKENLLLGNGIYTNALIKCLDLPRIPIEGMFKKVREIVSTETQNSQIPWEHTSLLGDFYFNPDIANGSSKAIYSKTALEDATYMFTKDSVLKDIINDLKSHDWYVQNPAMTRLGAIDWSLASVNEIFILGRNIYQTACGGSNNAENYLDNLTYNLNNLPYDVIKHLLNGMTYEIYFDRNGKLRKSFKTTQFENVIGAFELRKSEELKFIQSELTKNDAYVLYIPGSEQKLIFSVTLKLNDENQPTFEVVDVACNGQSVFYNLEGTEKYISEDIWHYSIESKIKFEEEVRKKIVAPKERIEFIFSHDCKNIITPDSFSLRWYGK